MTINCGSQSLPLPSFQKVFHRHLMIHLPSRIGSNQSPSPPREVYPNGNSTSISPNQSPSPPPDIEQQHHIRRGMCHHPGCGKRARRGGFCVSHGGGRRCSTVDCTKAVQTGGKVGKCFAHGGGKRCEDTHCSRRALRHNYCGRHSSQTAYN